MPRPRSPHVAGVKARLVARVRDGVHRPGDRFLSARAVALHFGISYQTAHRLLRELVSEGLLDRVAASGTYLAGSRSAARRPVWILPARARRAGSFGARLRAAVLARFAAEGLPLDVRWRGPRADPDGRASRLTAAALPLIWDDEATLRRCLDRRRSAVLLNERPPSAIESVFIDSVSVDDFAGGAYAAQLLERQRRRGRIAILAGPASDPRSQARIAGCLSRVRATVVHAASWYVDEGLAVAGRAVQAGPGGVFCANDRLAEAVHRWCRAEGRPRPPLVGFDDAPVAEELGLTTIAIPWEELAAAAAALVRRRLGDDSATATHVVLSPRPVVRT